ncbi:MAG: hypothetical protein ABIJ09_20840 [Pseudomonadota bacterium]
MRMLPYSTPQRVGQARPGRERGLRYAAVMPLDTPTALALGDRVLRSRLCCGPGPWLRPVDDAQRVRTLRRTGQGIVALVMLRASVNAEGRSAANEPALDLGDDLVRLAQWIEAVHEGGALALVELTHGGPRAGDLSSTRPVGPDTVVDPVHGRTPLPLTDLDAVTTCFDQAAARALQAGADLLGLEIAHGSLLHSWLSPLGWSRPVDEATRLQLPLRIARSLAARAVLMPTLCAEDLCPGGLTPTQGLAAACALRDAGASALVVTAGHRSVRHLQRPLRPPGPLREAPHARLASWVRRAVELPVGVVGGLRSRAAMDTLLREHAVDLLVLERPFLCEPDLGVDALNPDWSSSCSSALDCCPPSWPASPALDRCPSCGPAGGTGGPGETPEI